MSNTEQISKINEELLAAYDASWESILTNAAIEAVSGSTGLEVELVKSESKHQMPLELPPETYVSGIVGVNAGQIVGTINLMFPKETILKIAQTVYDREITEVDRSTLDCVGEMTNITYGVFKRGTDENKFSLQSSLPCVVLGNHTVVSLVSTRYFSADYKVEGGLPFRVSLVLHTNLFK